MKVERLIVCAFFIFFSCSPEQEEQPSPSHQEIRLYTQAAIFEKTDQAVDLEEYVVYFAKGTESGWYDDRWSANVQPGGLAVFSERHYYPEDNSAVYLRGYSPKAAINENKISYQLDGSQDIILTAEREGSLDDTFESKDKIFVFNHLLCQLRFRILSDPTFPQQVKLKSLMVNGSRTAAQMNLADGLLQFNGQPSTVKVYKDENSKEIINITSEPVTLNEFVMVEPESPLSLQLVVESPEGEEILYQDLPVLFHEENGHSNAGTSYLITVILSLRDKLTLQTSVSAWIDGLEGVGIVYD
ncbi:fimbrillin family protein [Parabacteroides sp. PF5-9]|uniref:fimbrillin family protein n=1 Tax=Parabacteroides sp. PF5-9 TaxID=1742404 RepID=UPI002473223B|nr:fimbrillin family protein [Parabacteroides sp. PF5-9]MDH6358338.1 hypothetical protein [Parabacteroides sp. PF5-9]